LITKLLAGGQKQLEPDINISKSPFVGVLSPTNSQCTYKQQGSFE